ncbi:MAG: glutathione peroxidase [Prevotella sp.]|nr:glutathione peroxidase [Prevotella sp.]
MKRLLTMLMVLVAMTAAAKQNIYKLTVVDADGQSVSMKQFKGKVLLIVNTATKCGFTPQYKELQALYERHHGCGLEILDFPCNQFGQQAPGTIGEIRQFCTEQFETTFPLFDKVDVNGPDASPLFTLLKQAQPFQGFDLNDRTGKMMDQMLRRQDADYDKKSDVKWNFTKFLVDQKGRVVRRFEPTESIDSVEAAVKQLLGM